jgi:hypothetical protein
MNNQLNQNIDMIINMANMKRNPQQIMQMMIQQNPQIREMMTQIQNMAQGRTPQEFITDLAKQNGISQDRIDQLLNIMGRK